MAREHASIQSSPAVPFSRNWTTANTPLTSIETFESCLSKLPPVSSRAIVAAALSQDADDYLQTINQSFANLLDWPAVIAHSVYPQSSLPPDHHPLDVSLLYSAHVSFSSSFPHDSTQHTPLEHVKLGLHFPPSNSNQTGSPNPTPVPTVAQYNLQSHVQPSLDYLNELDPKQSSHPHFKQKSRLAEPYAPSPKPPRPIDVFATIPIGRKKSLLGSPNLGRRHRPAVNRPSSELLASAKRLKTSRGTRSTPRRAPSRQIEVINLDDDAETDNFSLGSPAPQATNPTRSFALRSQPAPTLQPKPPASQRQPEKSQSQLQTQAGNGTHDTPAGVEHVEYTEGDTQLSSGEIIIARSKPLSEENNLAVEEDQVAPAPQKDIAHDHMTDEPETQDLLVIESIPMETVVGSKQATAAGAVDGDEVMEVPTTQTGSAAAAKGIESYKELDWKKQPDIDIVKSKIRETREKEDLKKAQRQEPLKLDHASLPDSGFSALQRRIEIQENKKKQAGKAAEKKKKALEKALERKRKIARRKRKAAAEAKGEVYNSESEENTDPAEPEENDTAPGPQAARGPTGVSSEVIDLVGNGEPSSIGQRMGPSTIPGYPQPAKRHRLDHQNQRSRSDRPPIVDDSSFGYPQEVMDQGSWQRGNTNRGMPPAQHAYTGGNLEGKLPVNRPNPRNVHPAQGIPRYWSTPEQDPDGPVMLNKQYPKQRQMPPPSAPFQAPRGSSPQTPSSYADIPQQHSVPMSLPSDARPHPHQMEQRQGFWSGGPREAGPHAPKNPYRPGSYGGAAQRGGERQRLAPPLFEKKRKELLDQISGVMGDLQAEDRHVIEDFLDNQRYMFAPGETEKDYRLLLRNRVLTKLRLNGDTGEWFVLRARV